MSEEGRTNVTSEFQTRFICVTDRNSTNIERGKDESTIKERSHTWRILHTSSVAELIADDAGVSTVPAVVTHCTPVAMETDLHSTLVLVVSVHQTNVSIGTVGIHIWRGRGEGGRGTQTVLYIHMPCAIKTFSLAQYDAIRILLANAIENNLAKHVKRVLVKNLNADLFSV